MLPGRLGEQGQDPCRRGVRDLPHSLQAPGLKGYSQGGRATTTALSKRNRPLDSSRGLVRNGRTGRRRAYVRSGAQPPSSKRKVSCIRPPGPLRLRIMR